MTMIPENTVTVEDIAAWNDLHDQLAVIKGKEMLLRTKIFKGLFTDPKEGTNTINLALDWKLKGIRKVDRKIELPLLQAMAGENGPLHIAGIRADDLVKWTPELKIAAYRELTEEQRLVFDSCLVIKDGSPSLELVAPKAKA